MNISIILPTFSEFDPIVETLDSINNQIFKPVEIIIVDSSLTTEIQIIINKYKSSIPIIYHWIPKAYPGHARNIGVNQSKSDTIAFLDSKTIPELNWLSDYINIYKNNDIFFIQGKTHYLANNFFQNIVRSATFGNHSHNTLPGSLIKKSFFLKLKGFNRNLRAGEDQEFIKKIYENNKSIYIPKKNYLNYKGLPNSLFNCLFKYFIYSIHTAKVNIQINIKYAYLIIFLIMSILLNNHLKNIYFFSFNKLYLDFIFLFFFLCLSISNIFLSTVAKIVNMKKLTYIPHLIFFFVIFYLSFIYNNRITIFFENYLNYFSHLGKIYFLFIISFSLFYRGIYLPLKRNINIKTLLPFNWAYISLIGLGIDIVKAPGYIAGGFISPLIYLINVIKNKKK